jgi:signal transduction histidine kinase/DNA-binding response OmpR family regulator
MRFFILLTLFLLCFSVAEASYIRSIRLQSFDTKSEAIQAKNNFENYAKSNNKISTLQEKFNFEYKVVKIGKYYITTIEPITDKPTVQTLLDIVRKKFPDAYPKKLKSYKFKSPQKIKTTPIVPTTITTDNKTVTEEENISKNIDIDEEKTQDVQIIQQNENLKHYEIDEKQDSKTELKDFIPKSNIMPKWYNDFKLYIIIALALLAFALLKILIKFKKEKDKYIDKDKFNNKKIQHLKTELNNKDKILSNATHELRTPMTAIMGLTHIVLEGDELPKQQREYIQKIENSAENMLKTINDILDISKIQAGKLKIEKAEFNINDILEYVLNTISIKAKNNNISISMNIDTDVPSHIVGDSFRLGQILINLLSNSVKFTKNGEVSLKVKKLFSRGDNIKLKFIVSDTGIGMTEEQLKNLFKSFHQADASTTREYGGTGLGLSISKQLIEMMGGEIKVNSTKDVGTTFTFDISFKLKDSQNKRQYRLPSASLLNKSILIVDGSSKNVISLISSLGYFNYKTNSIPSFEKAILSYDIKPDIIIINQTNLTNLAIKKIKDIQKKHNSKIVVLSELYSVISDKSLQGLKIDAYLKTPFTQQNILNMITELYVSKNLDNRSRKKKIKDRLKDLAHKKILVAEDNELNHKVITGLLSHTDIELTFVKNGREAIELLNDNIDFDMIFMDINMPILDGYEATLEIRKKKKYKDIPIIALSADVSEDAINKSFASGMNDYISKPIIVDAFYKKIFDILSKSTKRKVTLKNKETQTDKNELKELSASIGLDRCDNDFKFYTLILKDFKTMYKDSPKKLIYLCQHNKFKEARHMAMDIKDIALNIGAYNLCESAATMEYEFEKPNCKHWKELINSYAKNLENLFKDIDKYLEEK